jgi:hypothetical protein
VQTDDTAQPVSTVEEVQAWKATQTFEGDPAQHVCSWKKCKNHRIHDHFVCLKTGKAHGEPSLKTHFYSAWTNIAKAAFFHLKGTLLVVYACLCSLSRMICNQHLLTRTAHLALIDRSIEALKFKPAVNSLNCAACDETCQSRFTTAMTRTLVCGISARSFSPSAEVAPKEEAGAHVSVCLEHPAFLTFSYTCYLAVSLVVLCWPRSYAPCIGPAVQ